VAPLDEPAFLSPAGAPWLVDYDLDPERGRRLAGHLPGRAWTLWRYRELLPLRDPDDCVDLGEGGTPLVPLRRTAPPGVRLWLKQEAGNPTGSFKDRGLSLAVNRARELGAPGVEVASAGNAALALTAYAAAAGLRARVALPEDTPATIVARCRAHGAEVLAGGATLVDSAARLAERAAHAAPEDRFWNLSTLREPYRIEGKKTMGLELAEQLGWELPDWIVYPTGGGTGLIGMHKAFGELARLGLVDGERRSRFVAVQMAGCAPIVRAFEAGAERAEPWQEPRTDVYGLRVPRALGDRLILRALRETDGRAIAVREHRLGEIAARAARDEGVVVGPEGAAALAAFQQLAEEGAFTRGDRVVVFQTGHPANYR
jgi:threonine synthase